MIELKHPLLTNHYTRILHEDPEQIRFGAPHHFLVTCAEPESMVPGGVAGYRELTHVDFQEGPCKENGVNGVANEDLLHMVLVRLNGFQNTPYACKENAMAIARIEEALMWLRYRTESRAQNNTLGTSKI